MENLILLLAFAAGVVVLLVLWYIWTSNRLIALRNRMLQCRSGICVVLKQRNDLIPNLVSSLKAYVGHENEVLVRIAQLRANASASDTETEQIKTGNEMSSLLSRLHVSVEDYPDLKADTQFHRLQQNLEDMELQLQAIRRTYNAAVTDYNNAIEMFPSSVVARHKHHESAPLIDIPEEEKRNPDVGKLFK